MLFIHQCVLSDGNPPPPRLLCPASCPPCLPQILFSALGTSNAAARKDKIHKVRQFMYFSTDLQSATESSLCLLQNLLVKSCGSWQENFNGADVDDSAVKASQRPSGVPRAASE